MRTGALAIRRLLARWASMPPGTAPYPSSLLMAAIPARVAGVPEVVVATPPREGVLNDTILAAAHVAGVREVYAMGGAQAIAALAYGTESVPRVDKILGPGNIFVVLAKRRVFGAVDIDQLPGPTETLLVADGSADATLVAADMIAQAEHDPLASALLITTSEALRTARRGHAPARIFARRETIVASSRRVAASPWWTILTRHRAGQRLCSEHLCPLTADPWASWARAERRWRLLGRVRPRAPGHAWGRATSCPPQTARFSRPSTWGFRQDHYVRRGAATARAGEQRCRRGVGRREG